MFTDGGFAMDSLYQNYEEGVKAEETTASELFNKAVGQFSTPSTEWRVVDGYLDDALGDEARFADLSWSARPIPKLRLLERRAIWRKVSPSQPAAPCLWCRTSDWRSRRARS